MIDLTPLDVRKKRGDFRRMLRGYDPQEVDTFLELAAERLEALVKENMALQERSGLLGEQVKSSESREKAIQEALVSAQTLRQEISKQASREAEAMRDQAKKEAAMVTEQARSEARQLREQVEAEVSQARQQAVGDTELLKAKTESELERLTAELEHVIGDRTAAIDELERKRVRFLRAFRSLLERELDAVAIEEGKVASDDAILELDLTGGQRRVQARMIENAALGLLAEEDAVQADSEKAETKTEETEAVSGGDDAADATDAAADTAADVREEEQLSASADDVSAEEPPSDAEVAEPVAAASAPSVEEEDVEVTDVAELAPEEEAAAAVEDLSVDGLADEEALANLDPDGLDSLVDRVLADDEDLVSTPPLADGSDDAPVEDPDRDAGVPVAALAPEDAAPSLDDDARAAVNQLFERDDVAIASKDQGEPETEDAWTKVLRGDEKRAEAKDEGAEQAAPASEEDAKGSWAPNFPEKNRSENSSGWSRARDRDGSRWR
ncbi:MAG: DivIVA domain-containing protein [Longimicrobiales bacterium]